MPISEREILRLRLLDHLIDIHGHTERRLILLRVARLWTLHRNQHRRGRADHWHPRRLLRLAAAS